MGGSGSGFPLWKDKKYTVEDCFPLDINKLIRDKLIGLWKGRGSLVWKSTNTGEKTGSIGYWMDTDFASWITMTLDYAVTNREVEKKEIKEPIQLTTTRPNYGGKRWWFLCPLIKHGRLCNRRVGRLYLPPGSLYFGCRHCYHLTYTSCQDSHKYDSFLIPMAARLGCSLKEVKNFL